MNLGLKSKIFVFDKMIFDVPKIEFQLFQIKHILDRFPLAGFNGFRNLKSTINLTKVYGFFSFINWYFKILAFSQDIDYAWKVYTQWTLQTVTYQSATLDLGLAESLSATLEGFHVLWPSDAVLVVLTNFSVALFHVPALDFFTVWNIWHHILWLFIASARIVIIKHDEHFEFF